MIVVCVKQVPDADDVSVDPETGTLNRSDAPAVLNGSDHHAIEAALRLRERVGGTVITLTMGPPFAEAVLQAAVGAGADGGVLLTDRAFGGSDTWPTGLALARATDELDAVGAAGDRRTQRLGATDVRGGVRAVPRCGRTDRPT